MLRNTQTMTGRDIFDEMWGTADRLRTPYGEFHDWFSEEDPSRLRAKQREAEEVFRLTGITFNVYGRAEAEERLIPFDIIPRIISGREWQNLSRGIEQRSLTHDSQPNPLDHDAWKQSRNGQISYVSVPELYSSTFISM